MAKKSDLPQPPSHLETGGADLWRTIVLDYDLEASDLRVLEQACAHFDRAASARRQLEKSPDGLLVKDRFGQWKEHPAVAIEQNATRLFLAALRQLGLGLPPSPEAMRLPQPSGKHSRD